MQRVEFQETCWNVIEMQNVHFKPNLAHFSTFVVDWGAKSCQKMPLQMWVVTIAVKRKGSCLRQVDGVTWASCGQVTGNLRAPSLSGKLWLIQKVDPIIRCGGLET